MGKCILCGQEKRDSHAFESRSRKLTNAAAAISQPIAPPAGFQPGLSTRRETPAHLPSRETYLDLPLAQAYAFGKLDAPIGGVIGFTVGLPLALVADAASKDRFTFWAYVIIVGSTTIIGAVVAFHRKARQQFPVRLGLYDGLLMGAEEVMGFDLDGDGYIGRPARVEVELRRGGKPWKFESLEIREDRLINLARAVAGGQSFTERTASDFGIPRKEFNGLRDKFVSRGLATWKGEPGSTQGVELTDDGVDTIAEIARTPLPRSYRQGENYGGAPHARSSTQGLSGRYEHIEE